MSKASSHELSQFISQLNHDFLTLHQQKEDLFWEAKMGLGTDAAASQKKLCKADIEAQQFNQNAETLKTLKQLERASSGNTTDGDKKALKGWIHFFSANAIEDANAKALASEIIQMEGDLETARGGMDLGYIDPSTSRHVSASSNVLSNMMRVENDEAIRKAGYEGLRSIEPFVLDQGFLEIVKKRNQLGRSLGYEDYYDMKVQRAEGFQSSIFSRCWTILKRRRVRVPGVRSMHSLPSTARQRTSLGILVTLFPAILLQKKIPISSSRTHSSLE